MEKQKYDVERRRIEVLTDEQIEQIAERAAQVALNKVYTEIGRSVVKKALWIIGASVLAALVWLGRDGKIP